jgi:hypothetical protein
MSIIYQDCVFTVKKFNVKFLAILVTTFATNFYLLPIQFSLGQRSQATLVLSILSSGPKP